ncbi:carboxymethylenebutenolidase homolog [Columba livia]|uniref:Carboxymethylenebutenolidase homolog n=1 Tax=Columba livia TaxID=8932 RepID=A0A2I0MWB1_COLLI|nr:carboxymethylenebutenolidase homolog [Columba livia]PKK33969.1 carboxymethylenebutenolidase homolog [Columba livia]
MAHESAPCPCGIGNRFDCDGCGKEVQVEHFKAYVCKPPASTDKAVVVIHDIFAWQLPNTRHMDTCICPDFFAGRETWKSSDDCSKFDNCLETQDARKINKEADAVLKYLKERCGVKKLGVIGFCWGGVAVRHLMMTYSELKAGVSLYGLINDSDDIFNLLNPTFFIFAEKDDFIPLHQATLLKQKLKKNCKVNFEVKIYPGQTHGFVHRKRENINSQDKPFIEEGRKDMINWLNKYI